MIIIWNTHNTRCWQGYRTIGILTADGKEKLYSHFGIELAVSYRIKNTLITWSCNYTTSYLPKGVKNLYPYKILYMDVTAVLFIVPKGEPKCLLLGECMKCITYRKWNITQHYKEMSHQPMKRHGETLNVYY